MSGKGDKSVIDCVYVSSRFYAEGKENHIHLIQVVMLVHDGSKITSYFLIHIDVLIK